VSLGEVKTNQAKGVQRHPVDSPRSKVRCVGDLLRQSRQRKIAPRWERFDNTLRISIITAMTAQNQNQFGPRSILRVVISGVLLFCAKTRSQFNLLAGLPTMTAIEGFAGSLTEKKIR